MKDKELEIYKGFFDRVENIIKDDKEVSDEVKLIIILIELENMIRYKNCGVSNKVHDFVQKYRNYLYDNIKEKICPFGFIEKDGSPHICKVNCECEYATFGICNEDDSYEYSKGGIDAIDTLVKENKKSKEIIDEMLEYFRNNTITYPYSMLEVLCKAEHFLKGDK